MIVNPYQELMSLHDMYIESIEVKESDAYIRLNQAYFISGNEDYVLENPTIIARDLITIETNSDYPIRIKLISDDEVINLSYKEIDNYSFGILEEAYGFGLIHFYGYATIDDRSYDFLMDFHFCGNLEIKWDDKYLVEAK